jgi:transcriptional regulator with PAS, ATPase and Fis domain
MSDRRLLLIGGTSIIRALNEQIDRAARSDAKVLLTGESGTGKEVAARLIHERSSRRIFPLATINCAGIPDSLLESELFGYRRGSFTGATRNKPGLLEKVHRGTLFMDEVGEMSVRMQGMLLRFLETGEIQPLGSDRIGRRVDDVRVLAATNRDLHEHVSARSFRLDLYYRLNVIHLHIPPLKQHAEDIAPLLDHFLEMYSQRYQTPNRTVSAAALESLKRYAWPGNIRQLKNIAERLIVSGNAGPITVDELPPEIDGTVYQEPELYEGQPARQGRAEELLNRMLIGGESFWSAVYGPFMQRDLTRDDVRFIVRKGLLKTRGNYTGLTQAFNMAPDDYKRFINFLRKHQCQLSFHQFRAAPIESPSSTTLPDHFEGRDIERHGT